jgi:hypothetical protein
MLKADEKTTDYRTTGQQDQPSGIGGPMSEPMQINLAENAVLLDCDWNFEAVPDDELVACCYWEYARESGFIRDVRERCWKDQQAGGQRDKGLHTDLQKLQSIGYFAHCFLHGFFCPQDGVLPDALPLGPGEVRRLTGAFPKPWQLLTKEERQYRAYMPPRGIVDHMRIVPFERGLFLYVEDIVKMVTTQRALRDEANALARRQNPRLSEDTLSRMGKLQFPDIQPSVIYASGTENTLVQISWGIFTNEEIVQEFRKWVKANRPKDLPGPDGKGHNKARDWRVALERLGMMRLLHRFRLSEIEAKLPEAWRLYGKREWYKERKRSARTFHSFFPFLQEEEQPLSWPTRGGRSK